MSARKIRAGEAYVEATVKDSTKAGLESVRANLRTFATRTLVAGGAIFGAGVAIAASFIPAIQAAGDFRETVNKFDATFADQSAAARSFAGDLAATLGRDEADLLRGMSAFQAMLRGLDFEPGNAREMSQELQSLALDFASFHNLSDDEAMGRFISALSGSSEVLDQFGVNIKQAAIDEELLRMGLEKTAQTATEQEKTIARLNLIRRAMGQQGAIGDAEKTKDSYVNMLKRIEAEFSKAQRAVGEALMPIVLPLLQGVSVVARIVSQLAQKFPGLTVGVAAFAAVLLLAGGALLTVGTLAGIASFAITGLLSILSVAGTVIGVIFSPIGAVVALVLALAAGVALLGYWFLRHTETGKRFVAGFASAFGIIWAEFSRVFGAIVDALMKGEFEKAWEIAWLSVREVTTRALGYLYDYWLSWKNWFLKLVDETLGYFQKKWAGLFGDEKAAAAIDARTEMRAAARERSREFAATGFKTVADEIREAREAIIASLDDLSDEGVSADRNREQWPELIVGGVSASLVGPQTGTISSFVARSIGRALGGTVEQTAEDKMAGELAKHTTLLEEIRDKPPAAFTGGT